ncbi:MAG TPA: hypothetical protein VL463_21420 [Kofleriaceae bacterium]|nr:hypothetical protein [Kofleriaceae bacterium]
MKKLGFLVVAGAGAFLYVHRRRGGAWTLDSVIDTAADLLGTAQRRFSEVKDRIEQRTIHEAASAVAKATDQSKNAY